MAKKNKPEKSDVREVLIDGKDGKRIKELQAKLVDLQSAFKANQEMIGFILKDYAKNGEQIAGFNPETGMITLRKQEKKG